MLHTALVTWDAVMNAIQASNFTSTRPTLQVGGMAMGGLGSGLTYAWSMTPQQLDELLRASIADLPTLGLYTVATLPNDPTNALSVTWTTTAPAGA